ncbi:MAG: hypothetical protein VB102_15020 [Paludibacter sp.]|nr:hypothetical protein [Paludibacter sp.]
MKKKIKNITIIISTILFLTVTLFFSSDWFFPEWNGSYYLGNNLYLMDWEKGNKIIVHCKNKRGRTCYGGSPVIPHNYPREVYVLSAKADDKWIIVKAITTEDNNVCYYLIDKSFNINGLDWEIVNCDSIIQSQITGPLDSLNFEHLKNKYNISDKLSFRD